MKTREKHINLRQLIICLISGVIGCFLAAVCCHSLSISPLLRALLAFLALCACLFTGALISELTAPRNIGYGSRAVVIGVLCAGMVLTALVAMLFQAIYGVNKTFTSSSQPLVLVVDRSGSMEGANDEIAKAFLDELSARLTPGKEIELYGFYDSAFTSDSFTWKKDETPLFDRLRAAKGGSDFGPALSSLTEHEDCIIVLITDCQNIDSYVDVHTIDALKTNRNQFVAIQLVATPSQALKNVSDEYLEYQKGGADEQIAAYFKTSQVFAWEQKGLLTPSPQEPIGIWHLLMLAFLGALMRYVLYLAFGRNRQMILQILLGVLSGALCCLILHLPFAPSWMAEGAQLITQTALSLLPFCLLLSWYTTTQTHLVNEGVLTYGDPASSVTNSAAAPSASTNPPSTVPDKKEE